MSMVFIPEEDAATIPPEQAAALVASGALSPNQPGLQLPAQAATVPEGAATIPSEDVYRLRRSNVGSYTRVEVRDGRRIQLTFNEFDEVIDQTDLGPVTPSGGRKEVRRYEIVRDGRRIQVIEYDDGDTEETDLGPVTPTVTKTVVSVNEISTGGRRILRTTFSDGTFSDQDLGPVDTDTEDTGTGDTEDAAAAARAAADAAFRAQQRSDAFSRIRLLLTRFGLADLEGAVQNILTSGAVDITDSNAIIFALRGEPAYKRRFKANEARAKAGLPELDAATYIGLEQTYRDVLTANGLPQGFYDDPDDFNAWIEGEVSPSELQARIRDGYAKVRDADPAVKDQMQRLYGVSDNELAAYFLDPKRAKPLFDAAVARRQATAAQIAARGTEQGGLQLTKEEAESLALRGITPEEAQAQFTQRSQMAGLFEEMSGEETLTPEQKLGATFGYNVQAQEELRRRAQRRVAQFQGGGSFVSTRGQTSGTIETGLGGPQ